MSCYDYDKNRAEKSMFFSFINPKSFNNKVERYSYCDKNCELCKEIDGYYCISKEKFNIIEKKCFSCDNYDYNIEGINRCNSYTLYFNDIELIELTNCLYFSDRSK